MAKISGPIASAMRGKVGQVVAAKTVGGDTALRAYQPVVKNPNTLRQQVSRKKLKTASTLGAMFSEAIGIGYAKAQQGEKMYARNMFVRDCLDMNAAALVYENNAVTINYENLKFSKQDGIAVTPNGGLEPGTETGSYVLGLANTDAVVLGVGEQLGVILVVYTDINNPVAIIKKVAAPTVQISRAEMGGVTPLHAKAFYKIIPASGNEITTQTIPWKYPSATSNSAVINVNV